MQGNITQINHARLCFILILIFTDWYYISSLEVDAEKISHTIRSHWHVENSLHWCLDIGFQEDSCRIRAGYAAQNLAVIRQMALNFIKSNKTKKGGIMRQRKLAALDNQYLKTLLSG